MNLWAQMIIKHLIHLGVCHFCIAPGSRSTPLVLHIFQQKKIPTTIHYDERGIGFFALGMAKMQKKPVCLITTSGTAVGNLLPSLMEAFHAEIPLIFITADRPFELQNCGANQATNQTNIFDSWVFKSLSIPAYDPFVSPHALSTYLIHELQPPFLGPIHINCSFREPFDLNEIQEELDVSISHPIQGEKKLQKKTLIPIQTLILSAQKGLIFMGEGCPDLSKYLDTKNWPIIRDILSHSNPFTSIPYTEWMEKSPPDLILHFGKGFVSRSINQWLKSIKPKHYIHIANLTKTYNPYHNITQSIYAQEIEFAEQIQLPELDNSWKEHFLHQSKQIDATILELFEESTDLTEPYLFHFLNKTLKISPYVFLGNSTPVRTAHSFFQSDFICYANRGLSGIDGNIATAIGMQRALQKPFTAILGDQTFLHDLNSLSLDTKAICWIIINNHGGGIFSQLPIANHPSFERYFFAKHTHSFKHIAQFFNLKYVKIEHKKDLDSTSFAPGCIYEVNIPIEFTVNFYKKLKSKNLELRLERIS